MKKSTPINLNLCQTWLFHKLFGCFFFFLSSLKVSWECCESSRKGNLLMIKFLLEITWLYYPECPNETFHINITRKQGLIKLIILLDECFHHMMQWPTVEFEPLYIPAGFQCNFWVGIWKKKNQCAFFLDFNDFFIIKCIFYRF